MRNAGADLFRCFMMLMVVLHHAIVHTKFSGCNILKPLFVISNIGVIGFLVVSGWYGVSLTCRKVYTIAGQIIGYGIFFSFLSFPLSMCNVIPRPVLSVGNAWYGVAYLALLCVSPILNAGIETLHNQGRGRSAMLIVAVLLVLDWLSRTVGLGFSINGFGSHTFGTFVCIYCIVRLVRLEHGAEGLSFNHQRVFLIAVGAACVLAMVRYDCLSYNNPIMLVVTIILFIRFLKVNMNAWLYSVIRFTAPSVFAVYLIHDSHIVGKALMIGLPFEWLWRHPYRWTLFPIMIFAVYFACVLIDLCVRRLPLKCLAMICERTRTNE